MTGPGRFARRVGRRIVRSGAGARIARFTVLGVLAVHALLAVGAGSALAQRGPSPAGAHDRPETASGGPWVLDVDRAAPDRAAPDRGGPDRAGTDRAAPVHDASGRVTVIVPDAASLGRIHELGRRAEAALATAAAFFAAPAPDVTVVVQGDDDVYNAWVDPLGGPVVTVPLQPPWPGEVGSSAPDPLQLLLVHEMIHAVHFGGRPGSLPVRTGVVGADLPWPPPMWLLEGVAVWAESRSLPGGGGRLDDPDARAVIRALADSDDWPTLADAARLPSEAWPGGRTRYLLGGAFVERLVQRAGLPAFRDALRRFETAPPWSGFDDAWRAAVGGDLQREWAALRDELRAEAAALDDEIGELLVDASASESASESTPVSPDGPAPVRSPARSPAWSPDRTQLAWRDGRTVRVATVGPGGELTEARAVRLRSTPDRLAWTSSDALVYVRLRDGPDGRLGELHELSLQAGAERRLTRGARAHAAAPLGDGCIAFVRDDGLGSSQLRRWCDGGPDAGVVVWSAPSDARIVGLAASPAGRIAAIMDRAGRRSVVAWSPPERWPRSDRWSEPSPIPIALDGALRDPAWEGESALWLVSQADADRTGAWRVDAATGHAELWAAPRHGVVDLAPGVVAVRRVGGPVLARATDAPVRSVTGRHEPRPGEPLLDEARPNEPRRDGTEPRPYDPRAAVRPLGWLPSDLGAGAAGVRLVAVDPTRRYAIDVVAGRVPGDDGVWGHPAFGVTLRMGDAGLVPTPGRREPLSSTLRMGLLPYRPHRAPLESPRPHLEMAVNATVAWEPTVRMRARLVTRVADDGAVRTGGSVRIGSSDGAADAWGVPSRGWAAAVTGRTDPIAGGRSSGAWLDAAVWIPTGLPGGPTGQATVRTGWRPPASNPSSAFANGAASTSAALGWTVPVGAYLADGRWALQRVRFAPRLRLGVSASAAAPNAAWNMALGLEGLVAADLVLGYGATASLALEGGVAWSGAGGRPEAWLRWSVPGLP